MDEGNADRHHVGEEAEGSEEEYGADSRALGSRTQIDTEAGEEESAEQAGGYGSAIPELMDVID